MNTDEPMPALAGAISQDPLVDPQPGTVYVVRDDDEWHALLQQCAQRNQMLVVDFTASWCGPCQRMAPVYADLCTMAAADERTRDIFVFATVDIDACNATATACAVRAVPAFHVYWNRKLHASVKGANADRLRDMLLVCDEWHMQNGARD